MGGRESCGAIGKGTFPHSWLICSLHFIDVCLPSAPSGVWGTLGGAVALMATLLSYRWRLKKGWAGVHAVTPTES